MAREMGLKGARRAELQETLDQLVIEGRLFEGRRGHYALADRKSGYVPGRFSATTGGYGFVAPTRDIPNIEGDLFIPPDATADAMHGDRVLVEIVRVKPDGRAEGKVRSILHREQSLVVGRFHFSPHGCRVEPHDERVKGEIEIEPGKELPPASFYGERLGKVNPPRVSKPSELDGLIVTVAIHEFPSRYRLARGRVIEVLGREDDFGVDVEVMIRRYHIPYRFSEEALEQAKAIPEEIPEAEIVRRRDFRELPIVTIDGETARDFDDAVLVDHNDDGSWSLQVHIADVSHYVRPGSALDRDARQRGTSVYFPDRAVPMLPAALSTGICSLNPGVDRLVMSALLTLGPQGELRKADFCRGVIRSAARMTYTKVFRILEGDEELRAEYRELTPGFERMRDLAKLLMAKRRKRGAIDLDLPEPEIVFDDQDRMIGVKRSERNIAHRLIEELMLAANEAVAAHLLAARRELLHRVHESPSPKSLAELEQVARSFGHSLGLELRERTIQRSRKRRDGSKPLREVRLSADSGLDSRDLQRFVDHIEGRPEQRILSFRLLRSMKQARYSEINKGHFALAAKAYTHFTSPIRRYPDLVVHRALGAWLDGADGPSTEELAAIADHASMTERRAVDAERALMDWKKAKFMEQRMGDEFEAMVTSVAEPGMWVELVDLFVEGFVPVESIEGERFGYRENLRAMVGRRTGRKYGLGDRVQVRVDRIEWDRLRPELTCLGPWKPGKPA
ncbi:MAG: VacB/RNase II family 3'-5' exoribonuclease [Acidobacteria bacterium]|nr:VacB/RNase II family 3'-5' exoribonuclease [Acidobacteriota bacterium]